MIDRESPATIIRRLASDVRSLWTLERHAGVARSFGPVTLAKLAADLVTAPRHGALAIVHAHAVASPHRAALISESLELDYRKLDARVNQLTHALVRLGVRGGDRVGLVLKNGHEFFELHIALSALGAIGVQIGYRLKADEIAFIVSNADVRALFFDGALAETIAEATTTLPRDRVIAATVVDGFASYEALLASERHDGPAATSGDGGGGVMIYTSGTTGRGKGARREFSQMGVTAVLAMLAELPIAPEERHLAVAPLYHALSAIFVACVVGMGGCIVTRAHFDAEDTLATIERERITSLLLVPTMLSRLLALPPATRDKYDLSSLRWIMSGAAHLPTEVARGIEDWLGPILYNVYGATETGLVTLARPGEHTARPGTIGRAIAGNQIALIDKDGQPVPGNEVGELYVMNRMLMDGYHGDESATRAATSAAGISVGDLAYRDADGFYFIADRKTDMVNSGGVNVYPWEIEQRLHAHPAVQDVAVVGVPDAEWGESPVAWVVRRPDVEASAEQLIEFVREGLADYKRPRRVLFIDELPRNPTGKVLKRELRARFVEGRI